MKTTILQSLKQIETENNIKILYACESGSRAWGVPSQDSDYDVRFVYIHHPDWYLSIDEKRDVIELPVNSLLDINGWDIRKALKLFRKSNPSFQEWLQSGIVYDQRNSFINKVKDLRSEVFSPMACVHHYLSMAKGNYHKYLQGEQVKSKRYLYVLRPLLASRWIEEYSTMPPLLFNELLQAILPEGELRDQVDSLLHRKLSGAAKDVESKIDIINRYIESELKSLEAFAKHMDHEPMDPTNKLDQLFRETLKEVWST
ncbi:nucleotidyltransferase domain-containing protein [Paenibacillus sp. FSL W7-1287]|uniref:nucleotidyltransferase domain-containing protein n=1 Tax=Paenibacillus sp. FSL W7-1287 TaxID=2954538 RepID=UPI0030FB7DF9